MGAAAQFDRIGALARQGVTQGQDADFLAVLLAEQGDGAGLDGLFRRHQLGRGREVLADDRVHLVLDAGDLLVRQRGVVAEVEAHALGVDHLALLGDVRAEHVLQRGVQQVGGRVVGAGGRTRADLDRGGHGRADRQGRALGHLDRVNEQVGVLLGVQHPAFAVGPDEAALVAGLTAAFGVKGGLVQHDLDHLAGFGGLDRHAVLEDGDDLAFAGFAVIAGELGHAVLVAQGQPGAGRSRLARAGPVFARTGALLFHGAFEAVDIDREAATAGLVLRQVQREAVGVVEGEGRLAVQHVAGLEAGRGLIEQVHAATERGAEADLFLLQRVLDEGLGAAQLGIGLAHFLHQGRHQTVHQRVGGAQQVGVAHGAAHDAAQDIAPAFVRRGHAVGDQEGGRAQVVGDDAVRRGALALGLGRGQLFRGADQALEQIDFIVGVDALQHGGDALQTHAGVDAGLGKVANDLIVLLLVLHEDVVPDLHEAVAVLVRRTGRAAEDVVAVVVEDLGAGTARTVVAHGPEVVGGGDADDLLVGEAGDLLPDVEGFVVGVIDGDQQTAGIKAEFLGQQAPGALDGVVLEVVAEREVAQHFKEGVVTRGVADVVQVVVLAAGAHAFLRRRRALVGRGGGAGEIVLERHHARVDEQQGRVVLRHQRSRLHLLVAVGREVVEEGGADLFQAGHGVSL
ncbi:hypothetical protein D3C86_1125030 [compost metagenome]